MCIYNYSRKDFEVTTVLEVVRSQGICERRRTVAVFLPILMWRSWTLLAEGLLTPWIGISDRRDQTRLYLFYIKVSSAILLPGNVSCHCLSCCSVSLPTARNPAAWTISTNQYSSYVSMWSLIPCGGLVSTGVLTLTFRGHSVFRPLLEYPCYYTQLIYGKIIHVKPVHLSFEL